MTRVPLSTRWHALRTFWRYYWRAATIYDVHSPFLSAWVRAVLEDRRHYYIGGDMRRLRAWWTQSPVQLTLDQDLGAGSRAGQGAERRVADLARWSGVDAYTGMLLFRAAVFLQPLRMLELGTNLGFSAAYLRAARRQAHFITIEGEAAIARLAQESFRRLRLPAPDIRTGLFADLLGPAIEDLGSLDLVFIDGDHQATATATYLDTIWPNLHEESVVIIGDIHWSPEMEVAWDAARLRPGVTLSVDLYQLGLLFFRTAQRQPQHFTLIPARFKPWRMGFWAARN